MGGEENKCKEAEMALESRKGEPGMKMAWDATRAAAAPPRGVTDSIMKKLNHEPAVHSISLSIYSWDLMLWKIHFCSGISIFVTSTAPLLTPSG
ncbi:hypothetical protein RUM43_007677 [Polyplax serrata]|uniref:Uncharacterized protein n=1 Tax=Polyplax serrata TaxID=468196 RepID=A0AAN8P684_POLSC